MTSLTKNPHPPTKTIFSSAVWKTCRSFWRFDQVRTTYRTGEIPVQSHVCFSAFFRKSLKAVGHHSVKALWLVKTTWKIIGCVTFLPLPMNGSMRVMTTLSLSLWVDGRDSPCLDMQWHLRYTWIPRSGGIQILCRPVLLQKSYFLAGSVTKSHIFQQMNWLFLINS